MLPVQCIDSVVLNQRLFLTFCQLVANRDAKLSRTIDIIRVTLLAVRQHVECVCHGGRARHKGEGPINDNGFGRYEVTRSVDVCNRQVVLC
jgi:hypothetical protein